MTHVRSTSGSPHARTTSAATVRARLLGPHDELRQLFSHARDAAPTQTDPRGPLAACDTFLATLSRHIAAVEDVVYPAARRRLPSGPRQVAQHVRLARGLEVTMRALEASFYGDSYAPSGSRTVLWRRMDRLLALHVDAEVALLEALVPELEPAEQHALAERFEKAVVHGPTRPHPHSPHSSWLSPVQHRFWAVADRAMDVMDSRVIPVRPRRPRGRPGSLLTQYLSGTPTFVTRR